MNKEQLLDLLQELNLPKDEYYVLSGASLVIRGIREQAGDLDLCISRELFEQIKDKYDLTEDKKNECGFYKVDEYLEIVVNPKGTLKYDMKDGYPVEKLTTILEYKLKRNALKDQKDIENIKKFLNIKK